MIDSEKTSFVMGDKTYDLSKQLVQLWIPAISSAYFGLASIWGLPAPDKVVGTLAILATFLGVVLRISTNQYQASGLAHDGTLTITPTDQGSTIALNVAPSDLIDKDQVRLKVVSPSVKPPSSPEIA